MVVTTTATTVIILLNLILCARRARSNCYSNDIIVQTVVNVSIRCVPAEERYKDAQCVMLISYVRHKDDFETGNYD